MPKYVVIRVQDITLNREFVIADDERVVNVYENVLGHYAYIAREEPDAPLLP